MSDYIVLDTETTGLDPKSDRIIEIGAVRIRDRQVTTEYFHHYLQPDCAIHPAAVAVHGITEEFLRGKPRFDAVAHEFIDWVQGATVIIHNAPFDTGFLNMELARMNLLGLSHHVASVIDTLVMARSLYRGKKNDLNSLLARYNIENNERALHGALLDAKLLAALYLRMTQKQEVIEFGSGGGLKDNFQHSSLLEFDQDMSGLKTSWIDE